MKYRKKPVLIDAYQMLPERVNWHGYWPDWLQDAWNSGTINRSLSTDFALQIVTLEGVMQCSYNDWIIKGVDGELYPCKPDIFERTYEPQSSEAQREDS
jgi:hypothetical protein